jgi:hypothetical protein
MKSLQLPDAPSVTSCFARRATSPVSLRYTGQERSGSTLLLPRAAGEVALVAKRRVTEGASSRPNIP